MVALFSLWHHCGAALCVHVCGTVQEDLRGRYSASSSADGVSGWTVEETVEVNGRAHLGTLAVVPGGGLPPRRSPETPTSPALRQAYIAGYEGRRGRVCLASSSDGRRFFNIDNEVDRRRDGLNDDCLTAPGVAGSNSALARAGDTYIVPVVDRVRERELIWYRKDFGTAYGWREVRGIQVVELAQRLSEIRDSDEARAIARLER